MTSTRTPTRRAPTLIVYVQVGLALVAATILGFRAARTAIGQAVPEVDTTSHLLGALAVGVAASLTVAAAVLLLAGRRGPALAALGVTLLMELVILGAVASPPRLIAALPLGLAMALFVLTRPVPAGAPRTAAAVVALLLMLPVGFQYLVSGLVVPAPDLYGMYALFALLLAGTAILARRRSWWVLAVPPLAAGLWFLLISIGGQYFGWQP
ncbi:MAG: hypothetical protein H0U35_11240 [Sporichthyaceae bacterium]|nr:hypothetical protein [Sporichthyaceae bacterium]